MYSIDDMRRVVELGRRKKIDTKRSEMKWERDERRKELKSLYFFHFFSSFVFQCLMTRNEHLSMELLLILV